MLKPNSYWQSDNNIMNFPSSQIKDLLSFPYFEIQLLAEYRIYSFRANSNILMVYIGLKRNC